MKGANLLCAYKKPAEFKSFVFACLLVMLVAYPSYAQTINTVESRCVNTGQIVIAGTVGAGGPYQLSLVSYPVAYMPGAPHFTLHLPDTFSSLYPGNYTLQVTDQAGTVFNYPGINVAGNYVLPVNDSYIPVATSVTNCSVANGTISGVLTAGRPPFSYTIIAGPAQVGTVNTTGNFSGLVSGNYQVQAADSCQNVQTRNLTVAGFNASITIRNATIRLLTCNSFSLDTILISPGFPIGGRYEVINLDGSGGNVIRAAGTGFPAEFTLFSKNDVAARRVRIRVFDACGNVSIFTPTGFSNVPDFNITDATVNKVSCDSFSVDAVTTDPLPGPGYTFVVANASPGPLPVLYPAASLPIRFRASRSDLEEGRVTIRLMDSCGDIVRTYTPRTIANDWEFVGKLRATCSGVVVDSIRFVETPLLPVLVTIKATFNGPGGVIDSTTTQIITNLPYTLQGIPPNVSGLNTLITVTDACGDKLTQANDFTFTLNLGALKYDDCLNTSLRLTMLGTFSRPVTYTVSPSNGLPVDTTGKFVLPDGTYSFTATDACGRTDSVGPITISRGWTIGAAEKLRLCTPGFLTNRIGVPSRSIGRLIVRQFAGGQPVTVSSVLLDQRVFRTASNGCVDCAPDATINEWIQYDNTLPNATYTYVIEDSCGVSDTVTIVNDSIAYFGFYHVARVKNKCINKGDIIASWDNDGPASNFITVEVYDSNNSQIVGYGTAGNSNLAAYPNGQTLLTDYAPGLYVVKYRFSECSVVYADTVYIDTYVQPVINTVQSLVSCTGTGYPVIVNGANGVAPYTYQVVSSTPDNYTTLAQTNSVFILPASQATATVRVVDACLNSAVKTIPVTRSAAPFIRSNPSVFAACTLPFNFSLLTDSIYAGSVFEWTKLTGIGAGATVVGTRPSLPLRYNSIADTGTYQVRVRVPGSCYDMRSSYVVGAVAISCAPGVSGTVFNDANGLNDNLVNGVGTTAGTLYVSLIDSTNKTIAISTVTANGNYFFLDVARGRYTAVLGTTAGIVNAIAPLPQLPAGWVNTGEHIGSTAGSDGLVNGILNAIVVGATSVSQANFGIDQRPVANDVTAPVQSNPGGSNTVQVPALNGADAEDGTYDGVSGINTIVIQSLPLNAVLYYNGVAVVAGQVIQNYRPSLLRVDPIDGTVTVTFTYSEVDAASVMSAPALVTMVFRNFPQANVDSAYTSPGAPVVIAVLGNDDFGGDGPAATDITITATPLHGTAVVNNGGTTRNPVDDQILYTPANGYVGNDTLIYQICDSNGDCDTALVIIYIGSPVPVTLSNFTATPSGAEVLLGWTVQTAVNVKEYVVMHSTDGIHYSAIGSKAAAGTGQYQLRHEHPKVGMNYYQLKTVDVDGKLSYSKILAVKFTPSAMHAAAWPNPFSDRIQLLVQLEQAGQVQLSLYDATGRVVRNESFNGVKGRNQFVLDDLQWLPMSMYVLRVNSADATLQFRMIKE